MSNRSAISRPKKRAFNQSSILPPAALCMPIIVRIRVDAPSLSRSLRSRATMNSPYSGSISNAPVLPCILSWPGRVVDPVARRPVRLKCCICALAMYTVDRHTRATQIVHSAYIYRRADDIAAAANSSMEPVIARGKVRGIVVTSRIYYMCVIGGCAGKSFFPGRCRSVSPMIACIAGIRAYMRRKEKIIKRQFFSEGREVMEGTFASGGQI